MEQDVGSCGPTGQPGNRSDLIAGWMSVNNQDKFVPVKRWTIDPFWGKNFVDANWMWTMTRKSIDADTVKTLVRSIARDQLCNDARWAVTKSHWTSSVLTGMIPEELSQHFMILDILVNDILSLMTVKWESFVKNVLMHLQSNSASGLQLARSNLQAHTCVPTDCNDIMTMLEIVYIDLSRQVRDRAFCIDPRMNTSVSSQQISIKSVEYKDLMTSAGPSILEDLLGMKLNHDLWQSSLLLSTSRSRYHVLGRWWNQPT